MAVLPGRPQHAGVVTSAGEFGLSNERARSLRGQLDEESVALPGMQCRSCWLVPAQHLLTTCPSPSPRLCTAYNTEAAAQKAEPYVLSIEVQDVPGVLNQVGLAQARLGMGGRPGACTRWAACRLPADPPLLHCGGEPCLPAAPKGTPTLLPRAAGHRRVCAARLQRAEPGGGTQVGGSAGRGRVAAACTSCWQLARACKSSARACPPASTSTPQPSPLPNEPPSPSRCSEREGISRITI